MAWRSCGNELTRYVALLLLVGFFAFLGLYREERELMDDSSSLQNGTTVVSEQQHETVEDDDDLTMHTNKGEQVSDRFHEETHDSVGASSRAGTHSSSENAFQQEDFAQSLDDLALWSTLPDECQSYIDTDDMTLDLSVGRYVLRKDDAPPPYDHRSCFLMKPRYNCAYPDTASEERLAAPDYTWILQQQQQDDDSNACYISNLVRGPAELTQNSRSIVLFGTSYLRQTFQSIACTWRHQITRGYVQIGGTTASISRAGWVRPFQFGTIQDIHRIIPTANTSTMATDDVRWSGCHDYGICDLSSFYRPGVEPPNKGFDNCNDDVAMMEYDDRIRIYYVFRPWRYSADRIMERLALLECDADNVDTVFVSQDEQEIAQHGWDRPTFPNAEWKSFDDVLYTMREQQIRDLGFQFGADNPWINDPPDAHPCMPGIPDDEANLLLLLLRYNLSLS